MPRATANQRNQLQLAAERLDFAQKLQVLSNKIHTADNVTQIMLDLAPDTVFSRSVGIGALVWRSDPDLPRQKLTVEVDSK